LREVYVLSLDFEFKTVIKNTNKDASILNLPSDVLQNSHSVF